jgi:hypothetical protein
MADPFQQRFCNSCPYPNSLSAPSRANSALAITSHSSPMSPAKVSHGKCFEGILQPQSGKVIKKGKEQELHIQ